MLQYDSIFSQYVQMGDGEDNTVAKGIPEEENLYFLECSDVNNKCCNGIFQALSVVRVESPPQYVQMEDWEDDTVSIAIEE